MHDSTTPADLALIERADRFDLTIFRGRGKYHTEHFDSLAGARERGPALIAEVNNGRRTMIYAVTAEGQSTLVPDDYAGAEAVEEIPAAFVATLGRKAASGPAKGRRQAHGAKAAPKALGKRAAVLGAAQAGVLPPIPDMSAKTHTRYRRKLAKLVALVEAGDLDALRAFPINPYDSSMRMLERYRDLAATALEARRPA